MLLSKTSWATILSPTVQFAAICSPMDASAAIISPVVVFARIHLGERGVREHLLAECRGRDDLGVERDDLE